jgi:hypothetical protein
VTRKQRSKNEKPEEITHQTWAARADALAIREVYPPEEFAGFENFGEFPEWHPRQAEAIADSERQDLPK